MDSCESQRYQDAAMRAKPADEDTEPCCRECGKGNSKHKNGQPIITTLPNGHVRVICRG